MKKFILFVFLISFFVHNQIVFAQNSPRVYLSGSKESVAPGSTISVEVFLTTDKSVNAFDLSLSYKDGQLQFLDSDNSNSIVDIWQTKPEVSSKGQINLSGGILKSFKGENGFLVKISFKVLETNDALVTSDISFTRSNLFLADGKGTKVDASTSGFALSIKKDSEIKIESVIPFKPTLNDVLIEKELGSLKSKMFLQKIFNPWAIFWFLVFVICIWSVYNKHKRKL